MPRLELLEVEAVPGPAGKALEGDEARQPGDEPGGVEGVWVGHPIRQVA